jgi:murein DD-endopeptidase MepM/ murein hydrolase activator NlpD
MVGPPVNWKMPRKKSRVVVLALAVASYFFAEFSLPGGLVRRLWGQGSDDPGVAVVAVHRGNGDCLVLATTNCVDITITVDASRENTASSRPTPFTVATRGQKRMELATFEPQSASKPWDFHYRYQWLYGCPGAIPDDTVYMLPFGPADRHKLLQGAHGAFSHQAGSGNDFANDWDMPEGTVVLAARGGVVVGLRVDSTAHGVGERFKNSANYVILRHADGTYGEYLHLRPHGAMVKLGENVQAGQAIARSGNTGYTSRPHLHFGVFRIRDDNTRESLPVRIRTGEGVRTILEEGRVY